MAADSELSEATSNAGAETEEQVMRCPNCGDLDTRVKDSRPTADAAVRRRRKCAVCNFRFTTFERVMTRPAQWRWSLRASYTAMIGEKQWEWMYPALNRSHRPGNIS